MPYGLAAGAPVEPATWLWNLTPDDLKRAHQNRAARDKTPDVVVEREQAMADVEARRTALEEQGKQIRTEMLMKIRMKQDAQRQAAADAAARRRKVEDELIADVHAVRHVSACVSTYTPHVQSYFPCILGVWRSLALHGLLSNDQLLLCTGQCVSKGSKKCCR
jgi:hypothetical protein